MREPRPGKCRDFQNVMQELDKLKSARADLLHVCGLLDGIEIVADVMDAAARGSDNVIKVGEIAHDSASVAAQSALNPLLAVGCPQQV
jgi:hypothetical protein